MTMRMVCRFLSSRGKFHPHYPSAGKRYNVASEKAHFLPDVHVVIQTTPSSWVVAWTDHQEMIRTSRWPREKTSMSRRGNIMFVRANEHDNTKFMFEMVFEFLGYAP